MTCEIWKRQRDGSVQRCGDKASVIVNNLIMCQSCQDEWTRYLPSPQKVILFSDREDK